MKKQHEFTTAELTILLVVLAGIGGWVANIVKVFGMSFDPLTSMAVMRVVGIFVAPLGAILGYL